MRAAKGRYDPLLVETRALKGPRVFDFDHTSIRPWTVTKRYRHAQVERPVWREAICAERNEHVEIAKEGCILSADGYLMPTRKGQPPPDLRCFKQTQK